MYIALLNLELKIINSKYEEINRNAINCIKKKLKILIRKFLEDVAILNS